MAKIIPPIPSEPWPKTRWNSWAASDSRNSPLWGTIAAAGYTEVSRQHVPAELPLVVGPVLRGEADMVVGSRKLGAYEKEGHIRHAGVYILSGLVSLLHGRRLTDVSSGFRATSVSRGISYSK